MKDLPRLSGSVLLCDVAHDDRGKLNILGGGWTEIGANAKHINALINVQIPPRAETVTVEVHLWQWSAFLEEGSPEASAELVASVGDDRPGDDLPPSWQILAPVRLEVNLRPTTRYVMELTVDEEPLAFVTFGTRDEGSRADEASDEGDV